MVLLTSLYGLAQQHAECRQENWGLSTSNNPHAFAAALNIERTIQTSKQLIFFPSGISSIFYLCRKKNLGAELITCQKKKKTIPLHSQKKSLTSVGYLKTKRLC